MSEEQDLSQVTQTEIPASSPEMLPLALAIKELAPECVWELHGYEYEGLIWKDDINKKPSKEAVFARARELKANVPMVKLRRERDIRMKEVDWVTLRAMRTGEPIPQEWKDYMEALANITSTQTPEMADGRLINVTWPDRPDGKPVGYYKGY
jgi:hypothetical protein